MRLSPDEITRIIEKFKRDLNKVAKALTWAEEQHYQTINSSSDANQNPLQKFQISSEKLESILCERRREERARDKHSKSKNPDLIKALGKHFD